ncbi:MAG: GNAT family N-acetyltransferase [Myxococcota bacterium]|nr:GNAT family N-acetyltransferase [Myxococcota bacterium]HHW95861.1 GNAT family N-acetyltransferase [Oligoflexales bacterium]HQL57844.1 GNAT family N-acetyltransferase [Myxococcota bacterium]
MRTQPVLYTKRLILRPQQLTDIPELVRWAGDFEVADTALNIPHPYNDEAAIQWINYSLESWKNQQQAVFAIEFKYKPGLIGVIGLASIDYRHRNAEMGYWLGVPFWGQGLATEAAARILAFAFEGLDLDRVYAQYFVRNPASGRILEKIGMQQEGRLRSHVRQWGKPEDLILCGILRTEWLKNGQGRGEG